jgi:dTDP-glucose 4,6-dehydratase
MNILVTGSEGTLGKPLVKELRERGHRVCTVDMQHGAACDHARADISDSREWSQALKDLPSPDVVYHLAAEFGRLNGELFYERLWRTNVIGTRNILESQKERGFRLIFASSSEVYGDIDNDSLSEDLALPNDYPNDYALTKRVGEIQVARFARQFGTESMTLRFFNAYGPGEHFHRYRSVVCLFVHRALRGLPIDVYEGYHRVFMYIDDFIPTLANVCKRFKAGETVNIGGTEYRSVEELARIVIAETGQSPDLVRLVGAEKHNTRNKRPDITVARDLLDHRPTVPLEQGVAKTVEWMRGLPGDE